MQCSIRLSLCRNHRSIKEKDKSPPPHLERRQYLTAGLFRQTYHSTPVINGRDLFRDGRANVPIKCLLRTSSALARAELVCGEVWLSRWRCNGGQLKIIQPLNVKRHAR